MDRFLEIWRSTRGGPPETVLISYEAGVALAVAGGGEFFEQKLGEAGVKFCLLLEVDPAWAVSPGAGDAVAIVSICSAANVELVTALEVKMPLAVAAMARTGRVADQVSAVIPQKP